MLYQTVAVRKDNTATLNLFDSEGKAVKYADAIVKDYEYVAVLSVNKLGYRRVYTVGPGGQGVFNSTMERRKNFGPQPIG